MPPKLHLVRHAQGYHNLGPEYWSLVDPILTEEGKRQSLELSRRFPSKDAIELVCASPMRRAIYTGLEAFGSVLEENPERKLIALPDLQEVSDFPCDVGSDIASLRKEMDEAKLPVDLSFVEEDWTSKVGRYEGTMEKLRTRARDARIWLKNRPEKEIAVVSHGNFLHFLTDDWEDGCKHDATSWTNVEYRTYEFAEEENGSPEHLDDAPLQETTDSRHRRGKFSPSPTREAQKVICEQMLIGWAEQGYPVGTSKENTSIEVIE
ncbi:phosphoglycerate mutase-like protein, partial [Penicillium nucicola]|uniref:phosphoglycerate mutase-like protein n=1 Tax=Penicillium nucicola TaxID=1850975 RepID=UPI0025457F94